MLDRLHFLVHPLHGESLVLAALVAPGVPAVGGAGAVAVLHGRESDEAPDVEYAHGDAAPREESQGFPLSLLRRKMDER